MPRRFTIPLQNASSYVSGGAGAPINLVPNPYVITSMRLHLTFNITTVGAPTYVQDPYWRMISNLSIVGDKGRSFVSMGDVRPLHYENKIFLPMGQQFVAQTPPAGSATNAIRRANLLLHFGSRPVSPDGTYNPYDLTAGIPANQSQLSINLNWNTPASMSSTSGYVINSISVTPTLFVVQKKDNEADIVVPMVPNFTTQGFVPPATSATQGTPYPVPQSHFWHSSTVLSLYGAAPADNRSDSALTDIGVRLPKEGDARLFKMFWPDFAIATGRMGAVMDDDGTTFGTPVIATQADVGVGRLDMTTIGGNVNPLYGLDMRTWNPGDLMVDMGVASIGNALFMHRFYDVNS